VPGIEGPISTGPTAKAKLAIIICPVCQEFNGIPSERCSRCSYPFYSRQEPTEIIDKLLEMKA